MLGHSEGGSRMYRLAPNPGVNPYGATSLHPRRTSQHGHKVTAAVVVGFGNDPSGPKPTVDALLAGVRGGRQGDCPGGVAADLLG